MDVVSPEKRSEMMSGIRSKDTKPEIIIRKALYKLGFRYRLHSKNVAGRPDMVLKKYNAVIFIHGCFWHGHSCQLFKLPRTRTDFWKDKIGTNRARDAKVRHELRIKNWRIATVWECALKGKGKMQFDDLIGTLALWLQSVEPTITIQGYHDES